MTTSQVEKLPNDVEKPPEGCVSRVRLRDPQELQCKQKKKKKNASQRSLGSPAASIHD